MCEPLEILSCSRATQNCEPKVLCVVFCVLKMRGGYGQIRGYVRFGHLAFELQRYSDTRRKAISEHIEFHGVPRATQGGPS